MLGLGIPANAIKDEKFRFGAEKCGIAQARSLQIGLCALGNRAWVTVVGFAVAGFDDVAGQDQCRFFKERIDVGSSRVGDQLHVRRFDAFPASDRGAIESVAAVEFFFVEVRNGHRGVVLLAQRVGEAKVHEFDFVVLHHFHHVCNGFGHQGSPEKRRFAWG